MRTLFEIVDGAKDGNRPSPEECYFAMLALSALLAMDHHDLRDVCSDPRPLKCRLLMDGSFRRCKAALDADPQKWLGDQVPGNPEYDRFRAAGKRLLGRLEGGQS